MLILTRKSHESIIIGDEVKIILLYTKNNYARIGIEAPLDVSIYREEIYRRAAQEIKEPIIRFKKTRKII